MSAYRVRIKKTFAKSCISGRHYWGDFQEFRYLEEMITQDDNQITLETAVQYIKGVGPAQAKTFAELEEKIKEKDSSEVLPG